MFGIDTPDFVWFVDEAYYVTMAGRTVQHLLKLTALVASWVVMAPLRILSELLKMLGTLPIKTVGALIPDLGSADAFIKVANWTGSSSAKTIADGNFFLLCESVCVH